MNRWPHVLKASAIAIFMTATALLCGSAFAQEKSIVVASTTSTQDSGLFGYLLPIVKQRTGIEVKVLAAHAAGQPRAAAGSATCGAGAQHDVSCATRATRSPLPSP
jgi:ABC-type tungstate transport system permease subunit